MITFSEICNALEDRDKLENIKLSLKVGQNIFSLLDSDAQVSAVKLMEINPAKYKAILLDKKRSPIAYLMTDIQNRASND